MLTKGAENVCIVVPCYNAQNTLAATLNSALLQGDNTDVVVVDDGSTDQSLAVARGFESRVRIISGPNLGASAARNRGLAGTTADWVIFLDADDVLTAGTITVRLQAAKAATADVVICDWDEIIDDGRGNVRAGPTRSFPWQEFHHDPEIAAATSAWATTAAILYKRSLIQKIGGFRLDLPVIQDARFLFDAAYHGARFAHSAHVGAKYRVLPGSLSRRDPLKFWIDVLRNGEQIEALWRSRSNLTEGQKYALHGIFDNAARMFFSRDTELYRESLSAVDRVTQRPSRFVSVTRALSSVIGIAAARRLISLIG